LADGEAGRPERKFTPEQRKEVETLARKGCKTLTISSITGIPETTLRRQFGEVMTKQRALHKMDIRDAQNGLLEDGNPTMAIWLGKQQLEQTDKSVVEQTMNLKMYGQEAPIEDV
jgi:hypothetical protein